MNPLDKLPNRCKYLRGILENWVTPNRLERNFRKLEGLPPIDLREILENWRGYLIAARFGYM